MGVCARFNSEKAYKLLHDRLIIAMDELIKDFYNEATRGLSGEGKRDSEVEKATDTSETEHTGFGSLSGAARYISAKCYFYAQAIMESFGTGSKADTGPDTYWEDYRKSELFNPVRKDKIIVGRPKGSYVDIYGNRRGSSGKYEGINLEGKYYLNPRFEFERIDPISPSRSIQTAEAWTIKNGETRIERRLQLAIEEFFSKDIRKCFSEVSY